MDPSRFLYSPQHLRICAAIKRARMESPYTQKEIGFYLGLSSKKYANLENGKNGLKVIDFIKLFYLFKKPMEYYMSKDELPVPNEDVFGNPNFEIVQDLLNRIKETAKVRFITRAELVEKSGLTARQLQNMLDHIEQPIKWEQLQMIAKGLRCSPGYLLKCNDEDAEEIFKREYIWGDLLHVVSNKKEHIERTLDMLRKLKQ